MSYKRLYKFQETDELGQTHNDQEKLFSSAQRLRSAQNPQQGAGMCVGISCDWAKTSLTFRGVTLRNQLNPGRWPILQSAYGIGLRAGGQLARLQRAVEGSGLKIVNGGGQGEALATASSEGIVGYLEGVDGHCVFALSNGGGHAMGYRYEGGVAEFLDPNTGHWRGDDRDELLQLLVGPMIDTLYFGRIATLLLFKVELP